MIVMIMETVTTQNVNVTTAGLVKIEKATFVMNCQRYGQPMLLCLELYFMDFLV